MKTDENCVNDRVNASKGEVQATQERCRVPAAGVDAAGEERPPSRSLRATEAAVQDEGCREEEAGGGSDQDAEAREGC